MRELGLFEQYLLRLRSERLQAAHDKTLKAQDERAFVDIKATAHEAALIERILAALRELANDPGQFIKDNLK